MQEKNRRRARNDPHNRDYICPCGKSYLSYPALFTHIKQKHNGRVTYSLFRLQGKLLSLNQKMGKVEEDQNKDKIMTQKVKLKIRRQISLEIYVTTLQIFRENLHSNSKDYILDLILI